jgi:hypothetical protein
MEVKFHPAVRCDFLKAARKYHDVSPRLADEFDAEFKEAIAKAAQNPL